MTTEKIIATIRQKFIENFDEGLLLDTDVSKFHISEDDARDFRQACGSELSSPIMTWHLEKREALFPPDKKDVFAYLSFLLLRTKLEKQTHYGSKTIYYPAFDDNFQSLFNQYWLSQTNVLKAILDNAKEYIDAEEIGEKAIVHVNIGYRSWDYVSMSTYNNKTYDKFSVYNKGTKYSLKKTADCKPMIATYADVFIVTEKHFVRLSLGKNGPIDRTRHLLSDIKKINIANKNLLELFFHGHYDPQTIVLDDYKTALQLENHLTDLRQKFSRNKGKNWHKKSVDKN